MSTSNSERLLINATDMKKVAVIDGVGDYATVDLYLECECGEHIGNVEWPDDWPERVNAEFLKEKGYKVINA